MEGKEGEGRGVWEGGEGEGQGQECIPRQIPVSPLLSCKFPEMFIYHLASARAAAVIDNSEYVASQTTASP
jgi:hypothetical protein